MPPLLMLVTVWGTAENSLIIQQMLVNLCGARFSARSWLQSKQGPFGTDLSGRDMYRPTSHIGSYSHPRKAPGAPSASCSDRQYLVHVPLYAVTGPLAFFCVPLPTRVRVDSFRH